MPSRDRRTRRHSDSRWSSWFGPDVHREIWLARSSRRPRRSATGSRRLIATLASAPTACAPKNTRRFVGCAGRTGGCARNAKFWQKPRPSSRGRPDPGGLPVLSANQARFRVATMARVLGVSTSGYYAWRQRPPSARARADAELTARVRAIHADSRGTYGAPRIHADLAEAGVAVGCKRVARVMRAAGIAGVSRRRGPRTTRRDVQARPAPDRVECHFEADAPNRLWVADITYVPTLVGFLYLAIVFDVFSRRVVGVEQRRPEAVVHHSDQGCQYTSVAAAGNGAWRCRWVRWGIASITQWPRASSRCSSASCWPARSFPRTLRRGRRSSSSSKGGTTRGAGILR